MPAAFLAEIREAEWPREKRDRRAKLTFPCADGVEPDDLLVHWYRASLPRTKQPPIARLDERELLPVRIAERDRVLATPRLDTIHCHIVLAESLQPELATAVRDRERDPHAEPVAKAAGRRISKREEREIGAGVSVRVGIEQVIRARIVLIDALLHQ